jgi:hypothetical protein
MSAAAYPMNQYAPSFFQGVEVAPSMELGYDPRPFVYIYNPPNGQLTSLQELENDSVQIDVDSDFRLFSWYIPLFTGEFEVQLADSTGYYLFSGFMNSGGISQSQAVSTVFSPAHPFPAGGKILLNINDLSGSTNPLQIAFVGEKLFSTARQARRG